MRNNIEFREAAKRNGVRMWQVAEALGITPAALSVALRHELPDDLKENALQAVNDIAKGRGKK